MTSITIIHQRSDLINLTHNPKYLNRHFFSLNTAEIQEINNLTHGWIATRAYWAHKYTIRTLEQRGGPENHYSQKYYKKTVVME